MKKGTVKLIGLILGIIASVIVISNAVKTGYDNWKNKDAVESTSQTAQVQVIDEAA